jgi:hypothetical protein
MQVMSIAALHFRVREWVRIAFACDDDGNDGGAK